MRCKLLSLFVATGLVGFGAMAHSRNTANRYEPSSGINSTQRATSPSTSAVRRAQDELKDEGYYKGQINGVQGPRMRAAVRQFQRDWKIPATGHLNQKTLRTLGVRAS
jgi:peptidoglycan hydrolase-like protein with peptidoglycan-binding domain